LGGGAAYSFSFVFSLLTNHFVWSATYRVAQASELSSSRIENLPIRLDF